MDYVVAAANLRAFMFGIKGKLVSLRKPVKLAKIRFWGSQYRCKLSPYCLLSFVFCVCLFICFLLSFTVHCF